MEKRSPDRVVIDSDTYKRLIELCKKQPYKYTNVKQAANLILLEKLKKEKV